MVSGGMACVKYLLFLFNLIFAVSNGRGITVHGQDATGDDVPRRSVPLFGPLFSASRRLALPRVALGGRGLCYISVKPSGAASGNLISTRFARSDIEARRRRPHAGER